MMKMVVIFCEVVTQVNETRFPLDKELFLSSSIFKPVETYIYYFCSFF